jgi:hypothetical protein
LELPEALSDKVIQLPTSPGLEDIIFGQGFAGITDVKVGPDGYLYVVSIGQGKIFRIVPGAPDSPPAPLSFPNGDQVSTPDQEEELAPDQEEEPAPEDENGEPSTDQENGDDTGDGSSENNLFEG